MAYTSAAAAACFAKAAYKPAWQILLDSALDTKNKRGLAGVEALLDCGALLAGVETRCAQSVRHLGVCVHVENSNSA